MFINYSDIEDLQPYHGKAVALDVMDRYVPFPSTFIIHEMCVRGFCPFAPIVPDVPDDITWQDWILSDGVLQSEGTPGLFKRDLPPGTASGNNTLLSSLAQFQPQTAGVGGVLPGKRTLALDENVIADILAATRASASWKACEMEGRSWTGTAEENI